MSTPDSTEPVRPEHTSGTDHPGEDAPKSPGPPPGSVPGNPGPGTGPDADPAPGTTPGQDPSEAPKGPGPHDEAV